MDLDSLGDRQRCRITCAITKMRRMARALDASADDALEALHLRQHDAAERVDHLTSTARQIWETAIAIGIVIHETDPETEAEFAELTRGAKSAF